MRILEFVRRSIRLIIGIWGYNEEVEGTLMEKIKEFDIWNEVDSSDQVSNRVSGLAIRQVFNDHKDVVTSIECISRGGNHWMVYIY